MRKRYLNFKKSFDALQYHIQEFWQSKGLCLSILAYSEASSHSSSNSQKKNLILFSSSKDDQINPSEQSIFKRQDLYLLSSLSKIQRQKMGNVDMTKNQKFMSNHNQLNLQFISQKPLFYAEDIVFPLSTKGSMIVDTLGRRVKLAGGNWSGGHLCRQCVDGLEYRSLRDIAMDIRHKFHLNCIRLTYSLQLFFDNKLIKQQYLKANPELKGKTAMQIFDYTVKVLTEVGLMVILNNHTSASMWCCSNDDGDGMWWSYKYPENMFFQCAEDFARRYKDNPLVIGMDLRNQLRKAHGIDPSWGDGNALTDWHRAANKCADLIQVIAPHWLIIVAGLNYQTDLTGVHTKKIKLQIPNKLVYSGHFYSWSWAPSMATFSYQSFKKKMLNSQTFVRGYGYPYLLGEFGNNKRDGMWKYLVKYLKETDIDWIYWPIDGFKCDPDDPKEDETFGIFTHDFDGIRNPEIFDDLRKIGAPSNFKGDKEHIKMYKPRSQQDMEEHLNKEDENEFEIPETLRVSKSDTVEMLKFQEFDNKVEDNDEEQIKLQQIIEVAESKSNPKRLKKPEEQTQQFQLLSIEQANRMAKQKRQEIVDNG